jgi:hypothetical protein
MLLSHNNYMLNYFSVDKKYPRARNNCELEEHQNKITNPEFSNSIFKNHVPLCFTYLQFFPCVSVCVCVCVCVCVPFLSKSSVCFKGIYEYLPFHSK